MCNVASSDIINVKAAHQRLPVIPPRRPGQTHKPSPTTPTAADLSDFSGRYERRPRIFDSDRDRKAYGMIRQAELLEGDGKAVEAAKQYRLACKLSPGLADCFGI